MNKIVRGVAGLVFALATFANVGLAQGPATINNIQGLSGWKAQVDVWAQGPHRPVYWMHQNQVTPSTDGNSTAFFLGGNSGFSNVLYHRVLGDTPNASHYKLDMQLYIDRPQNSQALEFAVLQTTPGQWYKFSTQCSFSTGTWRVWDGTAHHWVASSAPCNRLPAMTWNHLTFEYERVGGKTHFIAVTVNGQRSMLNMFMHPQPVHYSGHTLTTHFQMDGNRTQSPYYVWLDRLSVTYW